MQSDQQVDRLIAAVRRRVDARNLSAAEDAIGVSRGYLRKAQGTTRNIMLAKFLGICAQADIDPAEVFAEVFPRKEPELDFGIPIPDRPVPHIVKRVRHRLDRDQEPAAAIPRSWLEWLDELRYDKPQRALRLVEETLDYVRRADLPFALGVWASTCRLLARNEEAFLACLEGLEIASRNEDQLGRADQLRRISFLTTAITANYEDALAISERVAGLYARSGRLEKLGRVLVDQGTLLYYQLRFPESEKSFQTGLELLETGERRHRMAALHGMGVLYQAWGRSEEAVEFIQRAATIAATRLEHGKLHWLQGLVLLDLQEFNSAHLCFEKALAELIETSPIDAALSVCDHVRALLNAGESAGARRRALVLRRLIEPLGDNLIASAAILDLLRCEGDSHVLTGAFIDTIRKRVEKGRQADARRHYDC